MMAMAMAMAMAETETNPRKVGGLEIEEAVDGLVVYEPVHGAFHHLNASASIIFELCNGKRDLDAIAALVAEAYDLPSAPSDETLEALGTLTERGLIRWDSPTGDRGVKMPKLLFEASNQRVDRLAAEAICMLNGAGVSCVLLKGASLRSWLYGDGTPRPYGDVDLLVPIVQVDLASTVLSGAGFQREYGLDAPHAYTLIRSDTEVVDLHWTLPHADADADHVWNVLSEHVESLDVGSVSVQVLDRPARAMNIVLHTFHHGAVEEKPIEDLSRALKVVEVDEWRVADKIAKDVEAVSAFTSGLEMVPAGVSVAAELGLISPKKAALLSLGAHNVHLAIAIDDFVSEPGSRARVLHHLFPSPQRMRRGYPVARHGTTGLLAAYSWRLVTRAPALLRGFWQWLRIAKEPSS
jgi:hypothetical protein